MSTARLEIRENKQYFWFFMNCLSWIYIREKKTKRYSESHKELAFLATFSAKRKSMLARFKEDEIPPSVKYIASLIKNTNKSLMVFFDCNLSVNHYHNLSQILNHKI